jgi:anti-sigma factor RsiW
MRGNGLGGESPADLPDAALWQHSRMIALPDDETADYLDLAGFADGLLDPDDRERVADRLARDPIAAADVTAALALAAPATLHDGPSEAIVVRASALVAGTAAAPDGKIIGFPRRHPARLELRGMARWGSLAAAVAVAGWLGFTLGIDASRSFAPVAAPGEVGFLHDMLDPSGSFMPDLSGDTQT